MVEGTDIGATLTPGCEGRKDERCELVRTVRRQTRPHRPQAQPPLHRPFVPARAPHRIRVQHVTACSLTLLTHPTNWRTFCALMNPARPGQSPAIRIDLVAETLHRSGQVVPLRPKSWLVLRYLMDRPGELALKQELLDAVWPEVAISEGNLNKSVGELRSALGDDRERPRFIETVSRRGFRWIGNALIKVVGAPERSASSSAPDAETALNIATESLVGRAKELSALQTCFERAMAGTRQVVFVTGEAGAGKSRLLETFLGRIQRDLPDVLVSRGLCIEAYGQHEPYRLLLEAAERLAAREDLGETIVSALRTNAPTWLRQMPSLAASSDAPRAASSDDAGMAPARMLREIATTLEEISRTRPLVLLLEDVHWSDLATVDACNLIARRRDPARLLIVATMRLADALVTQHPILPAKADLVARGHALEIPATPFSSDAVRDYLGERCPGITVDQDFCDWIHLQTAGNPLFVRILVDDLVERGVVSRDEVRGWRLAQPVSVLRETVPDSLRDLVERQADRLAPSQQAVIEAASVLPAEFPASIVAAVCQMPEEEVEDACSSLARRGHILRTVGRDTPGRDERFAFVHSMVRRILHERIPASRRRRLHLAAAGQLERRVAGQHDPQALQLALHYALANDPAKALSNLQRAADSVQSIPAPREVIVIREQILNLIEQSPDLPGHRRELIVAMMDLAQARQLAFAVVDAETEALCQRVVDLAVTAEDGRECFLGMMGLFSNRFYTGRYEEAREIGQRLLMAAEMAQHAFMKKSAHFAIAGASYRLANFDEAQTHFESCLEHSAQSSQTYGWDFHLMSLSHLALLAIHRGDADKARRLIREADEYETRTGVPHDAAVIPLFAYALALLGDNIEATQRVKRALDKSERIGAAAWIERARFVQGLLVSRAGDPLPGIRLMKESIARQERNNLQIDRTAYCALLAAELLRCSQPGAEKVVADGLACVEAAKECHFEPELRRMEAVLRDGAV